MTGSAYQTKRPRLLLTPQIILKISFVEGNQPNLWTTGMNDVIKVYKIPQLDTFLVRKPN